METKRAFAAIMISLVILLGYQYLFTPSEPTEAPTSVQQSQEAEQRASQPSVASAPPSIPTIFAPTLQGDAPTQLSQVLVQPPVAAGKQIVVETNLFRAIIVENGGGIKSFQLKNYKESLDEDSLLKEMVFTEMPSELPMQFAWGNGIPVEAINYTADQENVITGANGPETLVMKGSQGSGIEVERILTFSDDSYVINMEIIVKNTSDQAYQGAPFLRTTNKPFSLDKSKDRYLFHGPAVYLDSKLKEIKPANLVDEGPQNLSGNLSWVAYEDTYFLLGILPEKSESNKVQLAASSEDKVSTTVSGMQEIIPAGGEQKFVYKLFIGPKKLSILEQVGSDLGKVVNFGWFDVVAKPALFLLNFFYGYFNNYGFAIIMVTVLFKLLFWPISHKGMKSMKAMQKIQPKMVTIREKFKNDKEKLNQEMMNLYKTYKVNPMGGCLPMVLQIPVFFALYKVLLQTIELRHAPFMLWVTDLAAPDRLSIGFDLPYLGGIPVLTLLMGGSMFLQQKMTPTPADPTQAKIMLFLPVIFTFMFLNFASGLVLYWFINNLLTIGQQFYINRSANA